MIQPEAVYWLVFCGKAAGAITAIGGFSLLIINWFKKISETNRNVTLFATNHLPHIQQALDAHGTALNGIKTDLRVMDERFMGVSQRVDDTREAIYALEGSFLRHVEVSPKETAKKSKR